MSKLFASPLRWLDLWLAPPTRTCTHRDRSRCGVYRDDRDRCPTDDLC